MAVTHGWTFNLTVAIVRMIFKQAMRDYPSAADLVKNQLGRARGTRLSL